MRVEKRSHTIHKEKRGFTLLELVVVIGIFLVVTSITVLNQRSFDNSIFIDNLAIEIALAVREAQVYGVGTRGTEAGFNSSYGLRFDLEENDTFKLFTDPSGVGEYGGESGVLESYTMTRGVTISNICAFDGSDCEDVEAVDVSFVRPNPEPKFFYYSDAGDDPIDDHSYSGVRVELSSISGKKKTITVGTTGQVVVE